MFAGKSNNWQTGIWTKNSEGQSKKSPHLHLIRKSENASVYRVAILVQISFRRRTIQTEVSSDLP
jgi:hypothetical protein